MATIKYLLKKSKINKEGKSPLYVAIYHEDQTELISTGEFIKKEFWDKDNQRVRAMKNLPEGVADIDAIIGKIRQSVEKIKRDLKSELEVDPSAFQIKNAWIQRQEKKKGEQRASEIKQKDNEKSVAKAIDRWIENLTHAALTTKAVTNSLKKFKEFCVLSGKSQIQDITRDLVDAYAKWLFEKKKLARSSHGRHIKHLRWFIKDLTPRPFDYHDLKMHNFRKKIVSLSLDELRKLEAVDVSAFTEKQKSKDLFLLGSYTGLRISDLRRITKSCIHIDMQTGDKEIHLTLQKNEKHVEIPILPETWEILTKYNMRAPKITEQTANAEIKKVCEKAGIDTMIKVSYTTGGKKRDKDVPKHELITLHVSGKTFISLAGQLWNLTVEDIASIVGKDVRTIIAHYKSFDNKTAKEKMRATLNQDNRQAV